jgi:hypothetical protein
LRISAVVVGVDCGRRRERHFIKAKLDSLKADGAKRISGLETAIECKRDAQGGRERRQVKV